MSPYSAVCKVYIAFTDAPTVLSPTWTEVTDDVRSVRTNRGRSNELDSFSAGSATVVLDNRARTYDPEYTAGAHYGDLKIRRQIKIEAVYSAVTYPIFRGYIQSYVQGYPAAGKDATCTIQAVDLFGILATLELPTSAYEMTLRPLAPTLWWGMGDTGPTAVPKNGNGYFLGYGADRTRVDALDPGGDGASRVEMVAGVKLLASATFPTALTMSSETTIAAILQADTSAGTVRVVRLFDSSSNIIGLQLANGVIGANCTQNSPSLNVQPSGGAADGVHHVAVTRLDADVKLYVDGVEVASSSSFGTNTFALTSIEVLYPTTVGYELDASIDEIALWDSSALSAANILKLAEAAFGWPGDTADARIARIIDYLGFNAATLDVGTPGVASSSVGPFNGGTDATSYLQSVARSDGALLFVTRGGQLYMSVKTDVPANTITFADDATAGSVYYTGFGLSLDDRLVFNKVTVSGVSGASFTQENTTSQADYSIRATSISTQLPTPNACRDVAEAITASHADPITRGSEITVIPEVLVGGGAAKGWSKVLGAELGDNATVKRTPPVGTAISQTVQITGISHTITPDNWATTFTTAPGRTVTVFRWGTSNWDGTDTWS